MAIVSYEEHLNLVSLAEIIAVTHLLWLHELGLPLEVQVECHNQDESLAPIPPTTILMNNIHLCCASTGDPT